MPVKRLRRLAVGVAAALAGSAAVVALHSTADAATSYGPTAAMVFTTANIGRGYPGAGTVSTAMKRIRDNMYTVSGGHPRFVGFQEIDEGDDIGDTADEMGILKNVYQYDNGWQRTIYRTTKDGKQVNLRVPEVAHDAQKSYRRIAYGADGLKGASPTRFITVTRYANQNISLLNTHFIASAWGTCSDRCAERRARWNQLWDNLATQVTTEHNAGFDVVVTADWNRTVASRNPASIATGASLVRSRKYDHIVALPRAGWKVVKVKRADGSYKQGEWSLGIDDHRAEWVEIRFAQN